MTCTVLVPVGHWQGGVGRGEEIRTAGYLFQKMATPALPQPFGGLYTDVQLQDIVFLWLDKRILAQQKLDSADDHVASFFESVCHFRRHLTRCDRIIDESFASGKIKRKSSVKAFKQQLQRAVMTRVGEYSAASLMFTEVF